MSRLRQSDIFKNNFALWKVFGIWSGRKPNRYYKYYSCVYLLTSLVLYDSMLTLNLAFTPLKIEYIIREVIFYFTEITIGVKAFMIIIMRDQILDALDLIDGKDLEGDDDVSKKIMEMHNAEYAKFLKLYAILSNVAYSTQVFISIVTHFIFNTQLELPICKYYFLSDELRDNYFIYWYIYQSWGMYGHMTYNVTIDSFISGLLLTTITQIKILNAKLKNMKLSDQEKALSLDIQEKILTQRLQICLRRYDLVLKYCDIIQNIMDITMFIVFGVSSAIICVVMCGLLLPSSTDFFIFMLIYLPAMTTQIFVPAYLGTQLNYESQELVFAAYCTEWIPRSESFKRSIRIFVCRALRPIQMTGLMLLPLSLSTFTSIVKSAYSFFALIRSFQQI